MERVCSWKWCVHGKGVFMERVCSWKGVCVKKRCLWKGGANINEKCKRKKK